MTEALHAIVISSTERDTTEDFSVFDDPPQLSRAPLDPHNPVSEAVDRVHVIVRGDAEAVLV